MFTKSKKFALILFSLLIGLATFVLVNRANEAHASGPWNCGDGAAGFMNAGVVKWCDDYYIFNAQRTQEAGGNPIFESAKDAGADGDHKPIFFLRMVPGANNTYGVQLVDSAGNVRSEAVYLHNYERSQDPFKAEDGTEYCSLVKYENCKTYDGKKVTTPSGDFDNNKSGGWAFDGSTYAGPAFTKEQIDLVTAILTGQAAKESANQSCQEAAGTLGFLFCPLFESISQSITNIVGVDPNANAAVDPNAPLMSLLIVRPLQFSSTSTLQAANNNVRDVANAAYVVIFIVIIFASFIDFGQDWIDNYTVKRVLPRLVAAIIFTQFSYLICAFVIDMGNAIGFAIPQLFGTTGLIANGQNSIQNALVAISGVAGGGALGIFAGFGGFLLALIFSIAVLVVLLIALVYMIFRLFALYLLVIVAPLAIAASVLPSTGKYFKMWGTNLIKLNIMFPLVVAVITVAGIISGILITEGCSAGANSELCQYFKVAPGAAAGASQVQGSSSMLVIAGALIPLFALMLIPKCLKLSGEIMAFTAGAVAGRLSAGGKSAANKAGEKYNERMDKSKELSQQKAAAGSHKYLLGKDRKSGNPSLRRRLAAGSGLRNKPKNVMDFAGKQQAALKPYVDAVGQASKAQQEKLLNSRDARYRVAALIAKGKQGDMESFINLTRNKRLSRSDQETAQKYDYSAFEKIPMFRPENMDYDNGKATGISKDYVSKLTADGIAGMNGAAQKHVIIDNYDQLNQGTKDALKTERYAGRLDNDARYTLENNGAAPPPNPVTGKQYKNPFIQ